MTAGGMNKIEKMIRDGIRETTMNFEFRAVNQRNKYDRIKR